MLSPCNSRHNDSKPTMFCMVSAGSLYLILKSSQQSTYFSEGITYSSCDSESDATVPSTATPREVHPKSDIVKIYSTYEGNWLKTHLITQNSAI